MSDFHREKGAKCYVDLSCVFAINRSSQFSHLLRPLDPIMDHTSVIRDINEENRRTRTATYSVVSYSFLSIRVNTMCARFASESSSTSTTVPRIDLKRSPEDEQRASSH